MVKSNVPTGRHHGAPKHGDALLAGLIRCDRCGRQLTLKYTGAKHGIPRYNGTGTSAEVITAVRQLVLIANDDRIAGILNRNGLKTGNGNRWTRERTKSMRSNYRIPVFKPAEDEMEPWLNLSNAAKLLQIAPKTLRLADTSERSRQSILSRKDHGSSLAPHSRHQPLDRSQNGHYRNRGTLRDRMPANKTSSLR